MADLYLFRSYPSPGGSWRPWNVYLDDKNVGKLGGAGVVAVSDIGEGKHEIKLQRRSAVTNIVQLTIRSNGQVLVLAATSESRAGLVLKTCDVIDELPKSCIPKYSPSGNEQAYEIGVRHAYIGLFVLLAGALGMLLACIGLLAYATLSGSAGGLSIVAILFGLFGFILAIKIRVPVRLLRNQRSWPFPEWRVTHKGEEMQEWRRLSRPIG